MHHISQRLFMASQGKLSTKTRFSQVRALLLCLQRIVTTALVPQHLFNYLCMPDILLCSSPESASQCRRLNAADLVFYTTLLRYGPHPL